MTVFSDGPTGGSWGTPLREKPAYPLWVQGAGGGLCPLDPRRN